MASRIIPVEVFDLFIFGGTGDLTYRKLLPALFQRFIQGQVVKGTRIVSLSRQVLSHNDYREKARKVLSDALSEDEQDAAVMLESFLNLLFHETMDATSPNDYKKMGEFFAPNSKRVCIFYLAVHPKLYGNISANLQASGLVSSAARVVLEKPIGWDGASADEINDSVGQVFHEEQVYRIDHYLGKETVQNLMALRFANALFEPLWNAAHVDSVEITVAESLGVEGRADYYDRAGALRDMVQNHILQLVCLIAMEPPTSMNADAVRDEKVKVLKALRPLSGELVRQKTVRGQYGAGANQDQNIVGYLDDAAVDSTSATETFVAMHIDIDNWRWSGVPFYVRTGKRMAERMSKIVVNFRGIRHSIFPEGAGDLVHNRLVVHLQPDEGITFEIMIKDPGLGGFRLRQAPLDVCFQNDMGFASADAYERLLMDVVRGNQTLFMRRDEVTAAWSWIDPILDMWAYNPEDVQSYQAGTWGPEASTAMLKTQNHSWSEER